MVGTPTQPLPSELFTYDSSGCEQQITLFDIIVIFMHRLILYGEDQNLIYTTNTFKN